MGLAFKQSRLRARGAHFSGRAGDTWDIQLVMRAVAKKKERRTGGMGRGLCGIEEGL